MRNYSRDPLGQYIKGIFILHDSKEFNEDIASLMSSLSCEVLTSSSGRMMVKATRGSLKAIKKSFLANDPNNKLAQELNTYVANIIIGS